MSILNKLQQDLKDSLKSGDKVRTDAIRMLISRLKNERISKGEDLTEDQEFSVLSKEAKKRKESIAMYRQGGREDLAAKEEQEFEIISSYLPAELSDEEIENIVNSVINETGAESLKDMGKVMGKVMPQVRGRADGKRIQEIVKKKLG
ncbi:GatB/YqeY domain-containing protein [candidate division KSB1 bacterium]|nr:MAG: GatB/YqeY domain-containing protein [candidate division KSB1 bacterium]